MPVDLQQFLSTFIEESLENVDEIEESLLTMDLKILNVEKINQIFRAAHTIKGNSGILNFKGISNLAHSMETLLDQARNNKLQLESQHVELLLGGADCIRNMLIEIKNKN